MTPSGTEVGQLELRRPAVGADTSAATACLIAAAPDLLAALTDLVARCDGEEGVRPDGSNINTCAAHAALEAATGEVTP